MTLSVGRIGLPSIALMIDDSASMGLKDRYPDDQTNELVDRLVRESGQTAKTRMAWPRRSSPATTASSSGSCRKSQAPVYRFSDTAAARTRDFTSPDESWR